MSLSTEWTNGVVIVRLNLETVEFHNRDEVRRELWTLLNPRTRLALDLEDLTALDAAGLSLFMKWIKETQTAEMNVCLFNLTKPVRALFEMMMLHQVVPVCESKQEALLYFGAAADRARLKVRSAAV